MELQQFQRRMVEFYNITLEECTGVLKFVVKLNKCEIVKEKKIERVTITKSEVVCVKLDVFWW